MESQNQNYRLHPRHVHASFMLEEWYGFLDMDRMLHSMSIYPGQERETQAYLRS